MARRDYLHCDPVRCCNCGRYISVEDMQDGSAKFEHAPDSDYSTESNDWTCRICVMKERKRLTGKR